jgi:hypothetical protein
MEYRHPDHPNEPYCPGMDYSVWWETNDGRPAGIHRAQIIAIRRYDGLYRKFFNYIFKLAAPNTGKGWVEMSVDVHSAIETKDY